MGSISQQRPFSPLPEATSTSDLIREGMRLQPWQDWVFHKSAVKPAAERDTDVRHRCNKVVNTSLNHD